MFLLRDIYYIAQNLELGKKQFYLYEKFKPKKTLIILFTAGNINMV